MAPQTSSRRAGSRTERRQAALRRRRQMATARTAAARRATQRRRRLKGAAILAALAVVAGTVGYLALREEKAPSVGLRAERVKGATGSLAMTATPVTYHGVYRSEAYQGTDVTESTEEIRVHRPFDGRVEIREGAPPGSTGQFSGRSTFGTYANYTEAGVAQIADDAPTVALGDIRVAASIQELVDQGLFVLGDRRRALDRECQTYRTGSPLQSLKITAPTPESYVDVCLDSAGLILEEVTVAGGAPTQRLTATSLELDIPFDAAIFAIEGPRVAADQGGAVVTEVDRTVAPTAGYWALGTPPTGFTHRGRYLVVGEGQSYVDVYVRGIDLVTVRQGPPAAEPELTDATPGREIDLGPLGTAQLLLRSVGPTLIAHPGAEAFVHVSASVSPAELQTIVSGLRRT